MTTLCLAFPRYYSIAKRWIGRILNIVLPEGGGRGERGGGQIYSV